MTKYKLLYKKNATPIKKVGSYTYWYYKDEFVVTKKTYNSTTKNRSIKERIIAVLEESDIIAVMSRNYTTFRGIEKMRKIMR